MTSVLETIAQRRATDFAAEVGERHLEAVIESAPPGPARREVAARFARPGLHLIAEIKRSSPSAGAMVDGQLDVAERARAYQAGGASMISVLVEPHWFGGSLEDLRLARAATTLPVLAKEFVVDARQLPMLRGAGADAVLLLAALHSPDDLGRLVELAFRVGLEPLVEAHDADELKAAVATDARLIGINNRDLRSFETSLSVSERLAPLVPADRIVVAESGMNTPADLARLGRIGISTFLIGESLMRQPDVTAATRLILTRPATPAAAE
jgi:indole-3-glycerol phosphate synthase